MSVGSGFTNFASGLRGAAGVNGGTVGIGEMTYGVSSAGAHAYLDGINTIAISNAIEKVQNTLAVKTALESGWQGSAELAFERKLDGAADMVVETLNKVKENIENLVTELVEDMANQDEHILDNLDDFSIGVGSESN